MVTHVLEVERDGTLFEVNLIIGETQFCLTSSRPGQACGYVSTPRRHYRLFRSGAVTSRLLHSKVGESCLHVGLLRQCRVIKGALWKIFVKFESKALLNLPNRTLSACHRTVYLMHLFIQLIELCSWHLRVSVRDITGIIVQLSHS
jgi:hypothetical protein